MVPAKQVAETKKLDKAKRAGLSANRDVIIPNKAPAVSMQSPSNF
jgi:hypothetical protein